MNLAGKRILVVEDDFAVADELCRDLRKEGAVVLGPAPTPFYALQLLGRRNVDSAVLDVRLHGQTVFGLADELCRRGTPILFATAEGEETFPERHRDRPRLKKPYRREELFEKLQDIQALPAHPEVQSAAPASRQNPLPAGDVQTRMMRAISAAMRLNARAVRGGQHR
ncbi:response regulator [Devosia salina]|uniref:Response regulator n=1 Tax=Devosia salina TaxID=2860336 RepID=A0ABX8WDC7_9HYPH|nr:response regulator [Devosia salina]QYO76084.1 response regulator [Devosia salina]